ncbi:hypothetical protein [Curtobacterium sp. 'Ferrero']|uniref:hypothetical protein n=1 Tax=Curtobacterium sp. 'Ferrero' TaxID=2033654 RepID=UPI001141FF80|nr:hypothetical protein [Curtobacterium sp. 'Ferrero']
MAVQVRTEAMLHLLGDEFRRGDAALQATYGGRDVLREYLRGDMSTWQLRGLVEALPPDSALHRAHRENDWSDSDWMLRDSNWVMKRLLFFVEGFLGKGTPEKPEPLPSPLDGRDFRTEAEAELDAQQKAEMDELAVGWFANN